MTTNTTADAPDLPTGWRFKVGIVLFALAFVPYSLLAPLIFRSQPLSTIASLVAGGMILQKIIMLTAIVALGKSGFTFLKAKLLQKLTPPVEVSPIRYRIGLVMFCLPFLESVVVTWASHIVPHLVMNRMWADIMWEAVFIASLFVLGGNFWDKLRALFTVNARAVFPQDSDTTAAAQLVR